MGFACDVTPEEAALGFERATFGAAGVIVSVRLGEGLRAVKLEQDGVVTYAVCNDALTVLYREARYLPELRLRFGIGDRRAG